MTSEVKKISPRAGDRRVCMLQNEMVAYVDGQVQDPIGHGRPWCVHVDELLDSGPGNDCWGLGA